MQNKISLFKKRALWVNIKNKQRLKIGMPYKPGQAIF